MASNEIFDPTRTSTAAEYSPGTRLQDDLGEEFYYVEADAAISVAAVVVIEIDHGASPITTTNGDLGLRVGVAKTAIANSSFGWVSIYGSGLISVAASCATDVKLFTTATGGRLDDAATAGGIVGIGVNPTSRSGSAGTVGAVWAYPVVYGA